MPTGTVAITSPKPTPSSGLTGLQFGLVGYAVALHSGILMTLRLPAVSSSQLAVSVGRLPLNPLFSAI